MRWSTWTRSKKASVRRRKWSRSPWFFRNISNSTMSDRALLHYLTVKLLLNGMLTSKIPRYAKASARCTTRSQSSRKYLPVSTSRSMSLSIVDQPRSSYLWIIATFLTYSFLDLLIFVLLKCWWFVLFFLFSCNRFRCNVDLQGGAMKYTERVLPRIQAQVWRRSGHSGKVRQSNVLNMLNFKVCSHVILFSQTN